MDNVSETYKNLDNETIEKIRDIIKKACTKDEGDGAEATGYGDCWRHYLSDGYYGEIDYLFEDDEIAKEVFNDVLYETFTDEELKEIWENSEDLEFERRV